MSTKSDNLIQTSMVTSSVSMVTRAVSKAFEDNRDYLLSQLLKIQMVERNKEQIFQNAEDEWISIDSMSKLRGIVGGRFDTLKAKWQLVGFPIKEKKGDQLPPFTVNPEGWIELETWLLKSGFAARLKPSDPQVLFEIKKSL